MRRSCGRLALSALVLAGALLGPLPARAAETSLDDVLSGFDGAAPESGAASALDEALSGFDDLSAAPASHTGIQWAPHLPEWLAVTGGVGLGSSFNYAHEAPEPGRTDQRGFSRLKASADLRLDGKMTSDWRWRLAGKGFYDLAYRINGHGNYTEDALDRYEDEVEFSEVYVQGTPSPSLDLKLGRQIVTWGKSDNIRVTDILNPLDNREPGLVDIRDLRLPVTMSKIDWFAGPWNVGAVVVHEIRTSKDPVFDNDFFPGAQPAPPEQKPSTSLRHQEFGLAVNGTFSGWDLSLYGAAVYDDQPHLERIATGLVRKHDRIRMAGAALNVAMGNWLLKGEAAYLTGLHFLATGAEEKERLDTLLGLEYSGFNETALSLEVVNRHLFGYTGALKQAPDYVIQDDLQSVLRLSRDFWNDRLTVTVLASTFDLTGDNGAFQRLTCAYDWSDATTITLGVINYDAGAKAAFRQIGANDRLFLEIRTSFGS